MERVVFDSFEAGVTDSIVRFATASDGERAVDSGSDASCETADSLFVGAASLGVEAISWPAATAAICFSVTALGLSTALD